jgi:hypothetical protein
MASQCHVCEGRSVKTFAYSNNGALIASFQVGHGLVIELPDKSFATEREAHEAALNAARELILKSNRDSGESA